MIRCLALLVLWLPAPFLFGATPAHEGLGPEPSTEPVMPGNEQQDLDEDELLVRQLRRRQRWIEGRITELNLVGEGAQRSHLQRRPELLDAQVLRDEAWKNLAAILSEPERGIVERGTDILERPADEIEDEDIAEMEAQNHLTMAIIHKERYEQGGRSDQLVLREVESYLERCQVKKLMPAMRPQRQYLAVWQACEAIRFLGDGSERQAAIQKAENMVAEFRASYPDSELARNATLLLETLDLDDNVRRRREALQEETGPASSEPAGGAQTTP